jgi:phosphoribosyl 1,2-cyclic phosphodiesterase
VPLYASDGTIAALGAGGQIKPLAPDVGQNVSAAEQIGSFDVLAFRTFHDAAEPLGFLIRSQTDGDKLVFATDTGNLRYRFPGITMLAIEANYQEEILARCTRIPEATVKRIRHTHMEIGQLCGYLSGLDLSGCRELYLLHLSDASSDEVWFEECVRHVVPAGCRVIVCGRGG